MPHDRNRLLTKLVVANLKWSPIVGVFGLRQVGKTTLVKDIIKTAGGIYESFDREPILESSRQTPSEFCERPRLFCIDEAQKGPWIFPAIKDIVGTKRRPGRFLLTGSVRFTLKKEIREALTGRIILHELLPFSVSEAMQISAPVFLKSLFLYASQSEAGHRSLEKFLHQVSKGKREITVKGIRQHLLMGGMPIPCFARDETKRHHWFEAYFETLLTRDVVLVDESLSRISYRQKLSFLRQLAFAQGQSATISQMALKSSLKPNQATALLSALEALSLIDRIPVEFYAQKTVRKMRIEWKDVGLWNHVIGMSQQNMFHDVATMSLFISQEFRSQVQYIEKPILWSYYQSRDGALIPWIFRQGQKALALTYLPVENPKELDYRALKDFVSREKHALGIILGTAKTPPALLGERIWLLPYTMVV